MNSPTSSGKESASGIPGKTSRIITRFLLSFMGFLALSAILTGCADRPPDRDEIPHIKSQLAELEKFYRGEYRKPPDSLLTGRFFAEIGKRGQWEALTVNGQSWPFTGFANRSFYYTKKMAEVDLSFRYHGPAGGADSLIPAKIRLNYKRGKWLVENVTPVKPLVY